MEPQTQSNLEGDAVAVSELYIWVSAFVLIHLFSIYFRAPSSSVCRLFDAKKVNVVPSFITFTLFCLQRSYLFAQCTNSSPDFTFLLVKYAGFWLA